MAKRFDYYARLSTKDKAVYRASDAIKDVAIPDADALHVHVVAVESALASGKRLATSKAVNDLVRALLKQLGASHVGVDVRLVRPQRESSELHGLYTYETEDAPPRIEVWMKTGAHERVVAFRSFLRTVLHEVAHHLDVTLFALTDSFHTQGFFQRESSLMRQLVPPRERSAKKESAPPKPTTRKGKQLSLF
jgi:hypothetical protein